MKRDEEKIKIDEDRKITGARWREKGEANRWINKMKRERERVDDKDREMKRERW